MNVDGNGHDSAGLAGPVAILGGLLLLVCAPIPRGSDYFAALIPLEFISLALLLALIGRALLHPELVGSAGRIQPLVIALVAAPLLIAVVQLVPIPASWWDQLPGHAKYGDALLAIDAPKVAARPISIAPDVTRASLLAGLPLVAALVLGLLSTLRQVRVLLRAVVIVAFAEVVLGLLQASGGEHSPFYFGMLTYGSPIGSFGTRNEFANMLAMALGVYVWLAFDAIRYKLRLQPGSPMNYGRFSHRHAIAAWVAGGLVLVVGILMSRSRAGASIGLAAGLLAFAAAGLRVFGWSRGWRFALPIAVLLIVTSVTMVGVDVVTSRVTGAQLNTAAGFRTELWQTSFQAALDFLPFGSGWGTYDIAYGAYQPPAIVGYANHAHMDYVEMLLEGGVLFVALGACFAWLAARRTVTLVRRALVQRKLEREAMLAALCGIALSGFLLHAAVDFPMRVPANAILACFLAGVFLRPLALDKGETPSPMQE